MEKQPSTSDLDTTQTQQEETLTSKDINDEEEQIPVEQTTIANAQPEDASQIEAETTISQAFPQQTTSENEDRETAISQQTTFENENTETTEIEDNSSNKSGTDNDKILLPHEELSSLNTASEAIEQQENEETSTREDKPVEEEVDYYPSWNKVTLPPTLMLGDLHSFYEDLQQYRGKRVQIIGESVQKIDTASLQLLLAFINSPEITVCWHNYSTTLQEAADLLGLTTELSLPDNSQCMTETIE